MDLIPCRHADAAGGKGGIADSKCRLAARGRKQAEHMAEWLMAQRLSKARILASPAERTRQAARALGLPYTETGRLRRGRLYRLA